MTEDKNTPTTQAQGEGDKILKDLDSLKSSLFEADRVRIDHVFLFSSNFQKAIGESDYEHIREKTDRVSRLMKLDAFAEFVLNVIGVRIGESKRDLLCSVPDVMDGLGEFPNLRVLTSLLQSGCNSSSYSDIGSRFFKRLFASQH